MTCTFTGDWVWAAQKKKEIKIKQTNAALTEALVDEYKVRATFSKVIETFGPSNPSSKS